MPPEDSFAIDAIQKANSGHPGTPLDAAPTAYTLWQQDAHAEAQTILRKAKEEADQIVSRARTEAANLEKAGRQALEVAARVDCVLAMLELLRRGNDVAQMMQVTGEEGVSLEDHLVHQKSLFLDMVYFQQDAFDQVDASAPIPRQKRTFDLVSDLVNRPYQFKDKSAIRDYFVRLTGLFKNLNYSQEETAQYKEFLSKIQELADSTVNQNVKS
jgi:hypothetical protein